MPPSVATVLKASHKGANKGGEVARDHSRRGSRQLEEMNGNAKIPSVYLSSSLKWIVTLMFCGGTLPCDGFVRVPFVSSRQQAALYMLKNQSHSTSLPNDNDYDEFTLLSSAVSSGDWQEGAMVPWRGDAFNAQKKNGLKRRSLDLMWCGGAGQSCRQSIRERVVGDDNQFEFDGPATGQVCFTWQEEDQCILEEDVTIVPEVATASVLFLVKQHDKKLLQIAANAVQELTDSGIFVYLVPELAAKIEYKYGVRNDNVKLFEPRTSPGFGGNHVPIDDMWMAEFNQYDANAPEPLEASSPVDLICTLGGDGLLMHANVMFQGAVPPILCVAGGSLGFLTPFSRDEMVDAIRVSLGMVRGDNESPSGHYEDPVGIKAYDVLRRSDDYFNSGDYGRNNGSDESSSSAADAIPKYSFGLANRICISMRMRLECKVINREGVVRARFNVLNEVTVDRGSSPYLAALECFCDNVHLTTVQADGVIFAT